MTTAPRSALRAAPDHLGHAQAGPLDRVVRHEHGTDEVADQDRGDGPGKVESDLLRGRPTTLDYVLAPFVVIAARSRYRRRTEVPWGQMRHALAAEWRGVAIGTELPRFGTRPPRVLDADGAPVQLPIHA